MFGNHLMSLPISFLKEIYVYFFLDLYVAENTACTNKNNVYLLRDSFTYVHIHMYTV